MSAQIAHTGGGRELPIIFSSEMIRRIPPGGRKSQTRRTRGLNEINESPDDWTVESTTPEAATLLNRVTGELRTIRCPYGPAGTRLWVKEGWRPESCWVPRCTDCGGITVTYLADKATRDIGYEQIPDDWTIPVAARRGGVTPLFMPRWASRFTLISTGWRIERVQEISEADALAEGCVQTHCTPEDGDFYPGVWTAKFNYAILWDSINGKKLPFSRNGWVWVIGFKPEVIR